MMGGLFAKKIIAYETLKNFTYTNDALIRGDIKGIILSFMGLGSTAMFDENERGNALAEKEIIYLIPYINPWNWMNQQAVEYTDELIDLLFDHYDLPENTPVVSTGGSMGGLCSLVYTKYARRTPVACVANCRSTLSSTATRIRQSISTAILKSLWKK